MAGVFGNSLAASQAEQFDEKHAARDRGACFFDELATGPHRAAGGEQVIDDQYVLARPHAVDVHFQRVGAVFKVVVKRVRVVRQLAWLADGDEAGAQGQGQRSGEDKPPRASAAATA